MTFPLKFLAISVAMLTTPAIAQTDPHADHPKADKPAAPAGPTTDAAKPHCPMMATSKTGGPERQGAMPKPGAKDPAMSAEMMKMCMAEKPVAPAPKQGN
jgi:hypothetical protein